MRNFLPTGLLSVLLLSILVGCSSNPTEMSDVEIVELDEYETIVSFDDATLTAPVIIRYEMGSLFVFDSGQGSILKLDNNGKVTRKYGSRGRGPGEFQKVDNLFLTDRYLYAVDNRQFMIHKYDRAGDFISSMDVVSKTARPNSPPAPYNRRAVIPPDLNNLPFITLRDQVMLSSVKFEEQVETIYELSEWEGDRISTLGEVPDGSTFVIDYEQLSDDVGKRQVPSIYKPNAFLINDRSNDGEFFIVYSAIPKIAKYSTDGQKLWEKEVSGIPEIDTKKINFFEAMERMQRADPRNRIKLQHYYAGVSNEKGELFLILSQGDNTWIHQFSSEGELLTRFTLLNKKDDVELKPIFDIDFSDHRILVVTDEGEIWSYLY